MSDRSRAPTVEADDTGVSCRAGSDRRFGIRWEEIARVSASKLDVLHAVDTLVELDFDDGHFLTINGAFEGFAAALAQLAARLPGFAPDWADRIGRLAPDDDPITLWERAR